MEASSKFVGLPSLPIGRAPRFGAALRLAGSAEEGLLPRITVRGMLFYGLFYVLFGVFYAGTIAYTARDFNQANALPDYLWRVLLVDYPLKALCTLPVWWVLFRGPLRHLPLPWRLACHGWLCPLWLLAWFSSYYTVLGWLGHSGMRGAGRAWDVYIPVLFYGFQFGMLHATGFIQQLQQQTSLEQRLREQAYQSELAALKAQINPHFFFNTLNSISASVPPELEATRQLIAQLAHTFRFALAASRQELLPLGEELDFLRDYLALEQARFGERLRVCFAVDETLLPCLLPPMLVQPLVENAIRHGLAPALAGGTLTLSVQRENHHLRLTVADTGSGTIGPPAELLQQGTGLGLRNTHARLLALGSPGLELQINQPHGLQVSFVLPIRSDIARVE